MNSSDRNIRTAAIAALLSLCWTAGAVSANDETSNAPKTKLLLTVNEVRELMDDSKDSPVILLDCQDRAAYEKAHLPGARWVDVASWKSAALADGGAGLTNQKRWAELCGERGLTRDARIIVYGGDLPNAARVWWLLKYVGCRYVSLMDGGIDRWRQKELPVSDAQVEFSASTFDPEFQKQRLAICDGVKQAAQDRDWVVFDTRSASEFADGRVPGAAHLEWKRLLTEEGTFKPVSDLRRMFHALEMRPTRTAVTYCRSGGRASVEAFALELAGYENVRNYFCSWQEYSSDADAPIEK